MNAYNDFMAHLSVQYNELVRELHGLRIELISKTVILTGEQITDPRPDLACFKALARKAESKATLLAVNGGERDEDRRVRALGSTVLRQTAALMEMATLLERAGVCMTQLAAELDEREPHPTPVSVHVMNLRFILTDAKKCLQTYAA